MYVTSAGFTDFEVLIANQRAGGVYPATVIESPAGQAEGEFRLPMAAQELEALVDRMRALDTDEATLTDFGGRLFSALFHDDVLGRYAESVGMTSAVLGRSSKADFTLRAESVSRCHVEVKCGGEGNQHPRPG